MKLTLRVTSRTRIPDILARLRPALIQAVSETTEAVTGTAKSIVKVATGETRDSIHAEQIGITSFRIGAAAAALYLELGTMYMPPSPFLAPAVELNRDDFERRIAEAVRESVR